MTACAHIKVCRTCREPKHIEQFHKRTPARTPHRTPQTATQSECKTCAHQRRARHRAQRNAKGTPMATNDTAPAPKARGLRSALFLVEPPPLTSPEMASERRQHNRAPFHLRDRRRPTWRDVVVCVAFAWGLVLVVRAIGLIG